MIGSADLQIADFSGLNTAALDPALVDETAEWAAELDWDHSKLANLVRSLFIARRLAGVALLDRGEVAGYGYIGIEGHKGLVAGLYVRPPWRGGNAEAMLLRTLFDRLIANPAVTCIEAQLMLLDTASARTLERERAVHLFERLLMVQDSEALSPSGQPFSSPVFRIEPWDDSCQHAAAGVISLGYRGHIDARFHERYRTAAGAERFLRELIQFPGASFCRPASFIAFEAGSGSAAGISLAAFVADGVGHIAELCLTPQFRGAGLGQELLRRSIDALHQAGANRISLAVSRNNERAVRLYRQFGFREKRRFHAYVWERS